jgi:hypothetical protein
MRFRKTVADAPKVVRREANRLRDAGKFAEAEEIYIGLCRRANWRA